MRELENEKINRLVNGDEENWRGSEEVIQVKDKRWNGGLADRKLYKEERFFCYDTKMQLKELV